jgi:hypothetical protein
MYVSGWKLECAKGTEKGDVFLSRIPRAASGSNPEIRVCRHESDPYFLASQVLLQSLLYILFRILSL